MRLDWHELAGRLSPEEKAGIRKHLEVCREELKALLERFGRRRKIKLGH
jgi:hypothetical protein